MSKAGDDRGVLDVIERHVVERPELASSPSLRQLRGDALIGLAKRCRSTANKGDIAATTRARAWKQFHAYLDQAERELRDGLSGSVDVHLSEQIQISIDYLEGLRRDNPPPVQKPRTRRSAQP